MLEVITCLRNILLKHNWEHHRHWILRYKDVIWAPWCIKWPIIPLLVSQLLWMTTKKTSKQRITGPFKVYPPLSSQRVGIAEGASMSLDHDCLAVPTWESRVGRSPRLSPDVVNRRLDRYSRYPFIDNFCCGGTAWGSNLPRTTVKVRIYTSYIHIYI